MKATFCAVSLGLLMLVLVGCSQTPVDTPRLATLTAVNEAAPSPVPTPFLLRVPDSQNELESVESEQSGEVVRETGESITVWINTTSKENREVIDGIISDFKNESNIDVDLLFISPDSLPALVQAAADSGSLPDILFHPIEFSHGWQSLGILDSAAASEVLNKLDKNTFDARALEMMLVSSNDQGIAAIPSDLNRQLIFFRRDWLADINLEDPVTFDKMLEVAESIFDSENNIYGLVIPTESDLASSQRVFEQLALSNGCNLIDEEGEVSFLHPSCLESLEYYRNLVNQFSPIGVQTDISSLNAYLAGRTALIIAPASVLPSIAGLDADQRPSCPECEDPDFLVENSGLLFEVQGTGDFATPVAAAEINALGITTSADDDLAAAFADYWFNEGYAKWFSVDPEGKFPLRSGLPDDPTLFQDMWLEMPLRPDEPSLEEIFGQDVAGKFAEGASNLKRWGFDQHQGETITRIYDEPLLSPLLQEMLSGYITSSQTVIEIYLAIVGAIPDYSFPISVVLTPNPTP